MTPADAKRRQVEAYRQMTGEQRLVIGLQLYEASCEIARDGIRMRYPNATSEDVEQKLRDRIRAGYEIAKVQKAIP